MFSVHNLDTPRLIQHTVKNRDFDLPTTTDLSYSQRSSSCIQQHDRPHLSVTTVLQHSKTRLDLSCPQRSSSCILRLDRPQLPATIVQLHSTTRPTSPSRNNRPAAFKDSTDLSCPQRSSSCILRLDRPQLPATIVPSCIQQHDRPHPSRNNRPCSIQRLDRPQLPATIIQLHPTTRPTSAARNDHPAAILRLDRPQLPATIVPAAFYDSTDSYLHQTSSCISTTRPTSDCPHRTSKLRTSTSRPYQLSTSPI